MYLGVSYPAVIAITVIAILVVALPPLPKVRAQYRASMRMRHFIYRTIKAPAGLIPFAFAVTLGALSAGGALPYPGTQATPRAAEHSEASADPAMTELVRYAKTLGAQEPAHPAPELDEVETMIGRLAARLEAAPDDVRGWRLLGWSYFNTGSFEKSAAAYKRAAELDPASSEIKRLQAEAEAEANKMPER